ncbi:MAG: RsmB/NOP family class I SAM-dependent RNA methyltransferase [Herbinix sp.]|nr:RsmB/NOP family class I SAM-dependent RNA methyltransferase [Herbinix sp.]
MNLPKLFEDRMRKLLGEEYEEYLQCYSKPHFGGLRVNTLKTSTEEFERICPFSIQRIPWVKNGYYYDTNEQPSKHPYYYGGLYYIQEPSAMTPASLLPINKGDKVLDICAAPGGKSTELGAKLCGEGLLVSNDISNSRAKALLKNIELFGIRNSLILSEAPNKLVQYFPEYFDKILIDAPCSGEGMFRKSPSIMKNWEQYGVDYYNKLQKEIILYAAKMLKPGGLLLYSTCTFSPEENEGTISYLMEECPEFHVVNAIPDLQTQKELELSYEGFDFGKPEWVDTKEELKNCIRLWPHKINGEGHFATLLYKEGNTNSKNTAPKDFKTAEYMEYNSNCGYRDNSNLKNAAAYGKYGNSLSEETIEFLDDLKFPINRDQLIVHEERVFLLPEGLPNLKGLRILRHGLLLGEMKKQRFEPSQALASSLKIADYDKIIRLEINDPNVIRYLKCESIEPEGDYSDGWYLVCAEEYPLGWLKIAKNNVKNKYLPGWRWM